MKVLWARARSPGAGLTAGEVVDAVAAGQRWAPRTIKTLLNRLVQKDAVDVTVEGRRYLYRARVAREAVEVRKTRRMRLPDAIIWAAARSESALLVTRNTKDFPKDDPGVRVPY